MNKNTIVGLVAVVLLSVSCNKNDIHKTRYAVDDSSVVEWKGSTNETSNTGSFSVTGDNIRVKDNKVVSGTFIIPIASIKNFNLPDELKGELLHHLKSADFFNIARYPQAFFKIIRIGSYSGGHQTAVTGANCMIVGDFTMIGKTNRISFPAKITITGDQLSTEAVFQIDRTKWGMNYASDPAGQLYIQPNVELHLKVKATKQ